MVHPEYRVLEEKPLAPLTDSLTPVYPATEGVTQHLLRKITAQALQKYLPAVNELLPPALVGKYQFMSLMDALQELHRPNKGRNIEEMLSLQSPIFQRLIFEELLAFQLGLQEIRAKRERLTAYPCPINNDIIQRFKSSLTFQLTSAQQRCVGELAIDMAKASPMMRLIQGDVGSGKTVVAALAMLKAIESGYQAAIMAPTELLAQQHFQNFKSWLEPLDINVVSLSGKLKVAAKREAIKK